MNTFLVAILALIGGEDVSPTPIPPKTPPIKIEFPDTENISPTPAPQPTPPAPNNEEPPTLSQGKLYVVKANGPFLLVASPRHLVQITYEKGPIRIRGLFLDGDKVESRNYVEPFITIVEPNEAGLSGDVELIAIPQGVKEEDDILRIMVKVGDGPRPPPVVPTPPAPKPDEVTPPTPTVPTGFRVIMAFESSESYPRETNNILNSTLIDAYMSSKCVLGDGNVPEWRKWDKDLVPKDSESKSMRDLWTQAKPKLGKLPQLIIAVNGKFFVVDMPPTEAETLTLLKKHGGE